MDDLFEDSEIEHARSVERAMSETRRFVESQNTLDDLFSEFTQVPTRRAPVTRVPVSPAAPRDLDFSDDIFSKADDPKPGMIRTDRGPMTPGQFAEAVMAEVNRREIDRLIKAGQF